MDDTTAATIANHIKPGIPREIGIHCDECIRYQAKLEIVAEE